MSTAFPLYIWVLVIDYALGIIMWTLIGRTAMNLFQPENSDFFFMKAFVRLTNPFLLLWKPISRRNFCCPLWCRFMWLGFSIWGAFTMMPWLMGYSVMGMLSFPLEGEMRDPWIYTLLK